MGDVTRASMPAASSRVPSPLICRWRSQLTKFDLAINLKTAKALGIDLPARRCSPARTS
jgi:hypothetical protein